MQEEVFERFSRGAGAGRRGGSGGTGLGLALVARHVRAHHGTVRIDDQHGSGDAAGKLHHRHHRHATPLFAVDDETGDTYDTLGAVDAAFGHIEDQEILRPLVVRLTAREQRILVLRFFEDRTQSEIGTELGLSQMHVSRVLSRTLATLRRGLEDADRRRPDPPRSA